MSPIASNIPPLLQLFSSEDKTIPFSTKFIPLFLTAPFTLKNSSMFSSLIVSNPKPLPVSVIPPAALLKWFLYDCTPNSVNATRKWEAKFTM
jgi:hypothetical protein